MALFFKHGPRFYRPTVTSWPLDCQLQLLRLQWGPKRLHDSPNGKLTVKILFDRRSLALGISRHSCDDGRKITYQAQFLNALFRVGVRKSRAQMRGNLGGI